MGTDHELAERVFDWMGNANKFAEIGLPRVSSSDRRGEGGGDSGL